MTKDERLWSKRELAEYLGVHVRTVDRMGIPRIPITITGQRPLVRYDPAQVKAWIDKKRTRKFDAAAGATP